MLSEPWTASRRALVLSWLLGVIATAVTCSNPSGPSCSTCTPPPAGSILVGAGDIGLCNSPAAEATAKLLDNLFPDPSVPGTVFTAGDNAYPHGSEDDFNKCYDPTWGRHINRTRPTPGNHEDEQPDARPYYNYFGNLAGPAFKGYYAYNVSSWRVIALNSEVPVDANSAQAQWLRADLTNNPQACTIAIWHRPVFTSSPNGENKDLVPLFKILYDANAEIVINGHEHMYERFAPQDSTGKADPARGVREFVVGTGGAGLYQFNTPKPNSEKVQSSFGILKLQLDDNQYSWEFMPALESGQTDSGVGTCH